MSFSTTVTSLIFAIDAIIAIVVGSTFFFAPSYVGDLIFKRETDGVHWHLLRCIGGQILGSTVFYRFRRLSQESRTSCFLVRILAHILLLVLTYHVRAVHSAIYNTQFATFVIRYSFGVIALSAFALIVAGWSLGDSFYPKMRFGNVLYQLDSFASIAIGIAWIACPHWLLHRQVNITMNETHAICGRYMGALFVSSYVLSTHALHWRNLQERRLAAETRAFVCFNILAAQIWSQVAYKRDWSGGHWVGISLFSTWTVIAFIYRYFADTDITINKTKSKHG